MPVAPGFAAATPPRRNASSAAPKGKKGKGKGRKGRKEKGRTTGAEPAPVLHTTPAVSTPAASTPAVSTPAVSIPAVSTPAASTHPVMQKGKRASDGEGPTSNRSKRSKRDPPSRADLPSSAPAWLMSASGMLRSEALGVEWLELVGTWEAFEVGEGFSFPTKLAAKGRPPCIGDWIQRARAPSYRAAIANPADFAQAFTAWWTSLQPEWRQSPGTLLLKTSGNLDAIRKPGTNGLLSVIAALFFWGFACRSNGRGDWLEAVDEVGWTLRQLVETPAEKGSGGL